MRLSKSNISALIVHHDMVIIFIGVVASKGNLLDLLAVLGIVQSHEVAASPRITGSSLDLHVWLNLEDGRSERITSFNIDVFFLVKSCHGICVSHQVLVLIVLLCNKLMAIHRCILSGWFFDVLHETASANLCRLITLNIIDLVL